MIKVIIGILGNLSATYYIFLKAASKHHPYIQYLISASHISTYHIAFQTSMEVCVKIFWRAEKRR